MRLLQVLIVTAAFLVASAAGAIEMTISSIDNGDFTTTINIGLSNNNSATVQGIEIDLTGLAGVANVTGGRAAQYNFAAFCGGGQCFGGVDSVKNAFFDRDNLAGGGYLAGDNQVELLRALALQASTQTGAIDPGLSGLPAGTDITITVQSIAGGGRLDIVGRYSNGTEVLPFDGGSVQIAAIPEPGTALLMGLGLAGLAAAGRRG